MAGNTFGSIFRVTTFGESHGNGLGVIIDGCPAGIKIDAAKIQEALDKRRPGAAINGIKTAAVTQRSEPDQAEILSGVFEGISEGTPISIVIRNTSQHSKDYGNLVNTFRPGHADYTYDSKYGFRDYRGGGRASGRETAARVAAGAVAAMILEQSGISVTAYTLRAAGISCTKKDFSNIAQNTMRAPDNEAAKLMEDKIEEFRKNGDSAGGIIECVVKGVPAGLGEPVFDNEKVKEGIVIVPDELYFLPNSNLKRMAKFYESYYKSFSRKRFDALVETFRFDKEKTLSKLSKGMKRQAAMILALSVRPKYLLFDETFDGLDPMVRQAFKQIIIKDVEDNNTTVIFTSHSLRELEGVCDTLAFINNDTVVFSGDIISIQNSMFKIQVVFKEEFDKDTFEGMEILGFEKNGSVANMIVKGDREEIEQKIKAMNPVLFDVVMLNLEEIFNYQVGASGYSFDMSLLEEE